MIINILILLVLFGGLISGAIWYTLFIVSNTYIDDSNELSFFDKTLNSINWLMRIISILPLIFGLIYGLMSIKSNTTDDIIYNIGYGMLTRGTLAFLVSIPIELVLYFIMFLLVCLSNMKTTSVQKKQRLNAMKLAEKNEEELKRNAEATKKVAIETLEKMRIKEKELVEAQKLELKKKHDIKIKQNEMIGLYLDSLKSLNSEEIRKAFKEVVSKYNLPIKEKDSSLNIEPKTVYIPSNEQYSYIENQLSEINNIVKNIILDSDILTDSKIKELAESNETSTNDLIFASLNLLKGNDTFPKQLSKLFETENFKKLNFHFNEICRFNKININLNERRLYEDKELKYRDSFSEMSDASRKEYGIAKKGHDGERKVSEHLELYNDVLINLENILFKVEGTTVEADNIIICETGVFCIETKNYGNSGETITVTKDGRWKRFKGREEIDIDNISEQHNRHIGIMQRTVNQELKNKGINTPYIYFEPIYVIANDEIEIKNESDEIKLLRTSSIYPYIQKFQNKNPLSKEIQDAIKSSILEHKQDLKKYPMKDFREAYKNNFENLITEIENKKIQILLFNEYINIVKNIYGLTIKEVNGKKYISIGNPTEQL